MYNFSYLEDEMDKNCQILIYNSTKPYYDQLINDLETILKEFNIVEETIEEDIPELMANRIINTYFDRYLVPSFNKQDIISLLNIMHKKELFQLFIHLMILIERN